jgi:hypothetical protein
LYIDAVISLLRGEAEIAKPVQTAEYPRTSAADQVFFLRMFMHG